MSLPLSLNPSLFQRLQFSQFPISKPSLSLSKSHICFSLSPTNNSPDYVREEARWIREEQRWLREEQRWLREEQRWNSERDSLLREIQTLKHRIHEMELLGSVQGGPSVNEMVANLANLLQVLMKEGEVGKKVNQIAESGSIAVPLVVEAVEKEKEVVVKEVVKVLEEKGKQLKDVKQRVTLRKGSEGDEVRAMQEALLKLGFYSGEEDMEYSSFSGGTERAVKTWQASFGATEDGIMTAKLLERLYLEQKVGGSGFKVNAAPKGNDVNVPHKEGVNGAVSAAITEISEIQQTVVKEEGVTEVEVSEKRVFLLGENRWEEPSRLSSRKKQGNGAKSKGGTTMCLTCRGEGRLLCTECDGTGEPNIEPQFLEWFDEVAKCPYCEGVGYTICDVCEGKTMIQP